MIDAPDGAMDRPVPVEPDDSRPEESRKNPPPTVAVRYGRMNHIGEFALPRALAPLGCGVKLVIQTNRGVEIGEPVSLTCTGCKNGVRREDMRNYVRNSGADFLRSRAGRVLRVATHADLVEERHIVAQREDQLRACRSLIARHELSMKLVDCEHIFGGERIVFYFMSEHRVDFRALVRDLASELQTRIEMRQVGARDEARLVADYETCGRECCCKNFLKTLRPVSMRNAKMQKATLDPSKVSGRCGRLKCCLRYEQETYEELNRRLPRVGERVQTREGPGVVVDRQILTQLVRVEREDGQSLVVPVEDLRDRPVPDQADTATDALARAQEIEDDWTLLDSDSVRNETPLAAEPPILEEEPSRAPEVAKGLPESPNSGSAEPPQRQRRRRRGRGRGRGRGGKPTDGPPVS